jgi:hypothetical protein
VNETLMRIVVDALAFLELSDDDVLDADTAVKLMEWFGYLLDGLSPGEKAELRAFVEREAAKAGDDPRESEERRRFLASFPATFLDDDPPEPDGGISSGHGD